MSDPTTLTIVEAAAALRAGSLSAKALLDAYLARIERHDRTLNCFITVMAAAARKAASEADRHRAGGALRSPLDGIPIGLKDNIDAAGAPTTNGMDWRRTPDEDAHVVARLRQAGAVILGKLNMHEGAFGATTDNPHHGRTQNPWRHGYTPGGSSGGSAAAVAARLCAAALGTDTMGSVRMPAAYCGITGLIATKGLISTRGVVPLSFSLDRVGPLCRSVDDLGLMLEAMAGFDAASPESARPPDPPLDPLRGGLSGWKVGVLANFETIEKEPDIAVAFADALDLIEASGAGIQILDLAGFDPAAARRAGLLISEAEAAFAFKDEMSDDPGAFSAGFLKMLEYGRDAPAWRLVKAQRIVAECGNAFRRLFDAVDLVVTPTTPQTAFSFERAAPDNQAEFAAIANFSGCPALSLPCGLSSDGLPIGVHLIAPPFQETRLLAAAAHLERTLGLKLTPTDCSAAPGVDVDRPDGQGRG